MQNGIAENRGYLPAAPKNAIDIPDDDALDREVQAHFAPSAPDPKTDFAQRLDDIIRDHCGGYLHREIAAVLRDLAADMRDAGAPC